MIGQLLHYWMTAATPHYWHWLAAYLVHFHRLPGIDLLLGA